MFNDKVQTIWSHENILDTDEWHNMFRIGRRIIKIFTFRRRQGKKRYLSGISFIIISCCLNRIKWVIYFTIILVMSTLIYTFVYLFGEFEALSPIFYSHKNCNAGTNTDTLKGQCHEIFCFRFFSWITFPQAPDNNIRIISNFLRKFAEIFASQGAPPVANCRRYQPPAANFPPVSTTPAANFASSSPCVFPRVSTTPVANFHRYQRHRRQICHRCPVSLTPVANNRNNIRLQIPESELEGKNLYICFLYYPKVTK